MNNLIHLERFNENHAERLIYYLNNDNNLFPYLYNKPYPPALLNKTEFINSNLKWEIDNHALLLTILAEHKIIGSCSLKNINLLNNSASTGIWLSSEFWNMGIGTTCLALRIAYAKKLKLKSLYAKIKIDNLRSKKVWEKFNASFYEDLNYYHAQILIDQS